VLVVAVLLLGVGLRVRGVAAERQEGTAPAVPVSVQGGMLSAKIEQVPLGVVLEQLARQADLTVYITASDAKQTVSATFEGLTLTEGIKRILQERSYALIMAPTFAADGKPSGERVAKIRVLSKGEAYTTIRGLQAAVPQDDTIAQLKRDALEAPHADAREAALEALADRYDEVDDLAAVVVSALRDATPQVRSMALSILPTVMIVAGEQVSNYIVEVAQKDPDPDLRASALGYLLTTRDAALKDHLQQALQDPDTRVSTMAQRLLEFTAQWPSQENPPQGTGKK
jgi:hypothetical protein